MKSSSTIRILRWRRVFQEPAFGEFGSAAILEDERSSGVSFGVVPPPRVSAPIYIFVSIVADALVGMHGDLLQLGDRNVGSAVQLPRAVVCQSEGGKAIDRLTQAGGGR